MQIKKATDQSNEPVSMTTRQSVPSDEDYVKALKTQEKGWVVTLLKYSKQKNDFVLDSLISNQITGLKEVLQNCTVGYLSKGA